MQVKLLLVCSHDGMNSFGLLFKIWENKLILNHQTNSRLTKKSAFVDGVRFSFGLTAFCYWASCIAFVYFARDAGADWMKTIAAASTSWTGSKLLMVTVDENHYAPWLVATTTVVSALCLLPLATLMSHHMGGRLFGRLLLAPTMINAVWVAIQRGEALPTKNRQAFLAGVCVTFFLGNLVCTAVAWFAPIVLPPAAIMCMAMITPLFDMLSWLGAAKSASAIAMLAMAFFSEPLLAHLAPDASVLIAGLGSFSLVLTFRKLSGAQ